MKKKTNLDEMQEQKLLKIEHTGFWIGFWGLAITIYIQLAMGHGDFMQIGGESLILMAMALYVLVQCIRNGIWDRKLKPNLKTNLIVSLITGLAVGVFWFAVSYHNYHALAGSFATFIVMFISVSILALVMLSITSAIYKRRRHQLDNKADLEENEE